MNSNTHLYTPTFLLLCLSHATFAASFTMIIPELPAYLTSLGGEDYKGLIIALFTLMAGLSRPFSGKLTDMVGRMPVMIFGTLVCVICSALYPLFTTVWGFLLLRFFHGFSTGFKPTAATVYTADIVPVDRRGEAMGILGVSMNTGASISPPLGSWLAMTYSIEIMFYVSSFMALLSILLLWQMPETIPNKKKFQISMLKISRDEVIDFSAIPPAIVTLLIYLFFGALLTIVPDQTVYLGMSNKGSYLLVLTACSILSRVFAGQVSDRLGREPVLRLSVILLSLSLVWMGFADSAFDLLVASGLVGFSLGMAAPAVFAWTIDRSAEDRRGRAMATTYIALELGIGLGALGSAWMYDNDAANFGKTFFWAAGITFLAFIYLWTRKMQKSPLD